jgi:hypothetical protein
MRQLVPSSTEAKLSYFSMDDVLRSWMTVVAASVLSAALLTSCGESWQCRQVEKGDYPALEDLAREVMTTVDYDKLERSSGCATTSHPSAGVFVSVAAWDVRDEAVAYLRRQNFQVDRDGNARTPDGRFFISVSGPARPRGSGQVGVFFQLTVD